MTLSQYLRVARTNWLLIAALTALGALGAAAYAWAQTPMYSASAQMFVSTTSNESDALAQLTQGNQFTQQRVKSYAAIITAPDVLNPVIKQLKLPYASATELTSHVSASSPLDTVLLDVKVTDTVPERARDTANAIAAQFTDYVGRLELPSGKGTSPVKLTVTAPAVAAGAPDSPKKMLDLALGLLVGLGLGIGLSVLRDSLDRTIGPHHDPGELTGAPVLAGMSDDPSVKDAPLIVHDPFAARAEAFRQLRTNIRYLSVDQEVRALVITSSVAGEGKTTTAANLAIAMAQGGENVVLIDADLRRPSIAELFGLPSGVGLTTVLVGDVPVEDAVQTWRDDLNLSVLTSGPLPPNPSELIGSHRMAELITQLTSVGFMVVVDSPPLLPVTDAAVLARLTGGALVVTRIGSTRIEQLSAAVEALRTAGAAVLGVVANRLPRRRGAASYAYRYGYGSEETYAPLAPAPAGTSSPRPAPPAPKGKRRTPRAAALGRGRNAPSMPAQVTSASMSAPMAATAPPTAPPTSPPAPRTETLPAAPLPTAQVAPAAPIAAAAPTAPTVLAASQTGRSVADVLSPTGETVPRAVNVLASKGSRLFSRSKRSDQAPAAQVVVNPPPIGPPPVAPPTAMIPAMATSPESWPVAAPPMVSATPVFEAPVVDHDPHDATVDHDGTVDHDATVDHGGADSAAGHPGAGTTLDHPVPASPTDLSFDDLVAASLRAVSRGDSAPQASIAEPFVAQPSMAEPFIVEPFVPEPFAVEPVTHEAPRFDPVGSAPIHAAPIHAAPIHVEPIHVERVDAEPIHVEPVDVEPADSEPIQQDPPTSPPAYSAAVPEPTPPLKYPFSAYSSDSEDLYAGTIYSLDEVAAPSVTSAVTAPHGHWTTTEVDPEPTPVVAFPAPVVDDPAEPASRELSPPEPSPNPMFTPRPAPAAPEPPRPPAARRSAPELPPIWSPKPAETPSRPANLPLTSASASPTSLPSAGFGFSSPSAVVMPGSDPWGGKQGAPLAAVSTVTAPPATVLDIDAAHELDAANHARARDAVDDDLPALVDHRPEAPGHHAEPAPQQGFLTLRSPRGSEPRTVEDRANEMRAAAMREAAARVAAQREAQREAKQEAEQEAEQAARTQAQHGWPIEQRSASPSTPLADGWPFPSPPVSPSAAATEWAAEPWPGPDVPSPEPVGLDGLFGDHHPTRPTRRDGGGWRPSRRR